MREVRAVIQLRQHAHQTEAPDGPPTDEFDQAVGGIGLWRDQHRAASVFAVVESEKEAAPLVPILVVVTAQRKGTPAQLNDARKNTEKIAELAQRFEEPIGQGANIGREADAAEIARIAFSGGVRSA